MSQEEGNAIVEFIGWSAVLVVPVLYLVVTLAQLQATTFAVASRFSCRIGFGTPFGKFPSGSL